MERKKILFVAEAVTLAHVGRPLALAATLDRERYDVHFACAPGHDMFLKGSDVRAWNITSISSARFLAALAAGKPVYDARTLQQYVQDDVRLLREARPDLVIGDFRLSLSVSARLAGVPYVGLVNAYWSPYVRQHYTVPAMGLSRALPIALAERLFRLARPLAFALHSVPLNQVRRAHGLAPLGHDLRRVYTDADRVLYCDIPEMFPATDLPPTHAYLGPVVWSPPTALPDWWHDLPAGGPLVYVTLGSSGQGALLPRVLQALAPLPVAVIAATAGKVDLEATGALAGARTAASTAARTGARTGARTTAGAAAAAGPVPGPGAAASNARVAPYLPGIEAARRTSLVICNGGSPTSQQALAAGVPVLGIAGNLDQYLNMHGVVASGAGALLRSDRLNEHTLRRAAVDLLEQPGRKAAAREVAGCMARYDAGARLSSLLLELLPG